jgi:zinc resistance-associated protein
LNWRLSLPGAKAKNVGLKIFFFEAPIIIAFILELCAENGMLKPMIAATAVLAIAGSSTLYAQQQLGGPSGGDQNPRVEQQYRPSADDIKAFTDARIAALRAGLELTPQQETNWPPFEQAVRDLAAQVAERVEARENSGEQKSTPSPFDRLQRRADAMARLATALKGVADAGTPLYQSLTDAQQRRFRLLAHMIRPHWMGGGGRNGMMGPHSDGNRQHGKNPDSDEDESDNL